MAFYSTFRSGTHKADNASTLQLKLKICTKRSAFGLVITKVEIRYSISLIFCASNLSLSIFFVLEKSILIWLVYVCLAKPFGLLLWPSAFRKGWKCLLPWQSSKAAKKMRGIFCVLFLLLCWILFYVTTSKALNFSVLDVVQNRWNT